MRHRLGTRASSGRYPLSTRDLLTSFEMVIGWATKQDGLGAPQLKALSDVIARVRLKPMPRLHVSTGFFFFLLTKDD